ncbi:MAG TPA: redoxin domain-containing protein, partial [Streptosporangiaceae bacterium]
MRSFVASRRRDIVIVLVSLAVMVVAALTLFRGPAPVTAPLGAGRQGAALQGAGLGFARLNRSAPAFDLPRLEGPGILQPAQLRGKPIVLNFWSSSCTVCQQEEPAIARVARATRGQVRYLGVD